MHQLAARGRRLALDLRSAEASHQAVAEPKAGRGRLDAVINAVGVAVICDAIETGAADLPSNAF